MKIIYFVIALVILVSAWALAGQKKDDVSQKVINDYNYMIGTQTVGSKYKFTEESMLVETARQIKDMGSNLLKFSMHPRYCTENYGLPENKEITSLTKLAQLEPSVKEVLNMDFKYYHIWVYGFSQYLPEPVGQKNDTTQVKFIGGYEDCYAEALYDELYDLTTYMLKEFNNSGKVFYLGNWEGDWHLRWDYDRTKPADEATLEGIKKWFKIRQKAIDDAKRDTEYQNVEIYHYMEVNLVQRGIDLNDKVLTNSVLKEVNPDYVSYSTYDVTNPPKTEAELNTKLKTALDYIESYLPAKEGLPEGKRVWIGEYGSPFMSHGEDVQDERAKWVIKAGLEWESPFILFWEMYNNEIKKETGEQVGYWMIDDEGKKQQIWYTHNKFYKESQRFVKRYYKEHNHVPSLAIFKEAALNFNALK
ncbi:MULTISPECIES: hypothetical protein [Carboxylicivirga]|uniref:Glycoside hydrolase family 42 N-terminal domain-containing protein n=1 Tax=Carboxylicivirga mesophila TaxID=1166478 RepID=A0ABS5KDR1_9BACT|nr:hypothetical protein [Carboxylicivirga mesophila]MBS2213116.1 hypothetical protein [Carboxylicivirga mesophila]